MYYFELQLWTRAVSWLDLQNGEASYRSVDICIWESSINRYGFKVYELSAHGILKAQVSIM